jgi:hypothetical protein
MIWKGREGKKSARPEVGKSERESQEQRARSQEVGSPKEMKAERLKAKDER